MKKLVLTTTAFAMLSVGGAVAADLPARQMYTKAAPAAPVMDWTGWYVGAGGGYGMYQSDSSIFTTGGGLVGSNGTPGGKGFFGTVQVGADYQIMPSWVVGVFADYDFSSIKGTAVANNLGLGTGVFNLSQRNAWAAGGRIGYLVTPQILTYFDGGYAQARFNGGEILSGATGAATGFSVANQTYSGYFLGGGTEIKLASNWSVKSEYRYASYSSQSTPVITDATGIATAATNSNKPVVQTVRTSLIYKFNWGR